MVDTATTAWVNAVVAAGGTVSGGRQTAVDNLIVGLKADGLFGGSKLGGLWLHRAENTQSALIDLVALAVATPVNSPVFTVDAGYAFNGSNSYLDLGSPPANFTKDSAHVAAWTTVAPVWAIIGHYDGQGAEIDYYSGQWHIGLGPNDNTPADTGATNAIGFALLTRTASNARAFYFNGTSVYSDAVTSTALCVVPIFVGGIAYLGGLIHPSTGTVTVSSVGGGLNATDNTNLKARLDTYFAAISGGAVTTLPAAAGSYTITGTAAAFLRKQVAAAGAYNITGTAATLVRTQTAAAGSYTLTGTAATFVRKQTAAAGAYNITGTAATFVANRVLPAAAGAYTITGTAANFVATANFVLPAAAGAYTITGAAAAFIVGGNAVLATDPGAYTITGTPATFIAGVTTTIAAGAGAYTITGSPATLVTANYLAAGAGSYALTGTAATFAISDNRTLAADAGAYTITGSPATFVITSTGPIVLTCDPGSYVITGSPANFLLIAAPGPGGGYAGAVYRAPPLRKRKKREELEELLELVRETPAPELPPPTPQQPVPPQPALIDMAPQAPALMTAARLTPPQRKTVTRAIVSDDEDDDDEAIELLLNLLS